VVSVETEAVAANPLLHLPGHLRLEVIAIININTNSSSSKVVVAVASGKLLLATRSLTNLR
jgi:hypothetical protein